MIAGITGHRDLGSRETETWVANQLKSIIREEGIQVGLTALAIGADQLFAQELIEANRSVKAVIPCKQYEITFQREQIALYKQWLNQASTVVQLPYTAPSEEAFWAAGRYVVDHCHLLLAVWDGQPAKGLGGTGDVVEYALKKEIQILHIDTRENRAHLL